MKTTIATILALLCVACQTPSTPEPQPAPTNCGNGGDCNENERPN